MPCNRSYTNTGSREEKFLAIVKVWVDDQFLCCMGTETSGNQRGIIDALDPAAVRCWMSYNYEPYAERFESELGKTIRGFFYDEPTMVSPFHTGDLPWTPKLEKKFQAQYGYSCRELYWSLLTPVDDLAGAKKHILQFRYDYWRLVGGLFAGAFPKQLAEWCDKYGLMFSGHNWPEEPSCQRLMMTTVGDIFYQQQYLHVPGTDFLFYENCFAEKAGMHPQGKNWARNLIYSAKHPSSVARYNGAVHTICESSACLGIDGSSPAIQKKMYDFLYAMGLSLMNPARAYDFSDFRKYVAAQDAAQPYWEHYKHFVDYMRIMCDFNSRGRTDTQIAVLSAVSGKFAFTDISEDTSIRRENTPLDPLGDCREAMLSTLDTLVRNQRDFELLFEDVLLASPVGSDGTLLAPESAFKVIILPNCYALDDAVWCKLDEFIKAGGTVIAVENTPTLPLKHDKCERQVKPLDTVKLALQDDFSTELLKQLSAVVPEKYSLSGQGSNEVLTHLRSCGAWQSLLVVNGTDDAKTLELSGSLCSNIRQVQDSRDGRSYRFMPGRKFVLCGNGAYLFSSEEPPANAPVFSGELECVQSLEDMEWQCTEPVRNTMLTALEYYTADGWKKLDDDGYCAERLDPEVMPTVRLRGSFNISDRVPEDLRLWFDRDGFADLEVNGRRVTAKAAEQLFEADNITVSIAEYCQTGQNVLTVEVPLSKYMSNKYGIRVHFHMLMNGCSPLVVMGSFAVAEDHTLSALPAVFRAGSVDKQGFPAFADKLTLTGSFDAPGCAEVTCLDIAQSCLPLSVELNGVDLGVRFWQNNALDVPQGVLKESGNVIKLTLYGEVKNMLGRGWLGNKIQKTPLILPVIKLSR